MSSQSSDAVARFEDAEPPEQAVVEATPFAGNPGRGQPHHDPVAPELLDELHLAIGKGLALVDIDEAASPDLIVQALASYADRVIAGKERLPEDADDAALALGCLYGQCLGRALGWGFAHVRCTRQPGILLVSSDARYTVGPRGVIDLALARGGNTLLEHFAKLRAPSTLPESDPGKYLKLT